MNIYYKYLKIKGKDIKWVHNPLWYYKKYIWYPLYNLKYDLEEYFFLHRPVWFSTEDGEKIFLPVSEARALSDTQIIKIMLTYFGMELDELDQTMAGLKENLRKEVSTIHFDDNMILPNYDRRIECWVLDL